MRKSLKMKRRLVREEWNEADRELEMGVTALTEATVEAVRKMCAAQGTAPPSRLN